jgi:lipopolysaccharide biosynthesis glycosyltransferase
MLQTILCASDNNYAQHLGIMLFSLLSNAKRPEGYEIIIINDSIENCNLEKIKKTIERYHASYRILDADLSKVEGLASFSYISKAMYFRIFIDEYLDENYQRVLYLDSDMIISDDISDLFILDMKGFEIAAVPDAHVFRNEKIELKKRLGINKREDYFNSGLLLIDLEKYRSADIKNRVFSFIKNSSDKLYFPDQDALNYVLHDRYLKLPITYNFQSAMKKHQLESNGYPKVIHYTGHAKPWFYFKKHPIKKAYLHYKKRSLWSEEKAVDLTFKNVLFSLFFMKNKISFYSK